MKFKIIFLFLIIKSHCIRCSSLNLSTASLNHQHQSVMDYDNHTLHQTRFNLKKKLTIEDLQSTTFPTHISNDIDMDFKSGKSAA